MTNGINHHTNGINHHGSHLVRCFVKSGKQINESPLLDLPQRVTEFMETCEGYVRRLKEEDKTSYVLDLQILNILFNKEAHVLNHIFEGIK